VTITGANFSNTVTSVTFGGVPASAVIILNATTITALTPPFSSTSDQTVDVVVTNRGIPSTLTNGFTYEAVRSPVIAGVQPASGPSTGGTTVVITGSNFVAGATVTFGGVAATNVSIVSSTELQARTPPRAVPLAATSVRVDVSVQAGGLSGTAPGAFTYFPFTATDTILAFGDSITEGYTVVEGPDGLEPIDCNECLHSYPNQLTMLMGARYGSRQPISVVTDAGRGGETTHRGVARFPTTLEPGQDLVLLMEGANDASACVPVGDTVRNLRIMAETATGAGKKVLLATITPNLDETVLPDCPSSEAVRVRAVNDRLRQLSLPGVTIVDAYEAINNNVGLYMSPDGKHPSVAGLRRIAEEFFAAIVARFETIPPVVP
jgi:lysophospholipase L1-like esterase